MALKLHLSDGTVLDFPSLSVARPYPGDDNFIQGLDSGMTPWLLVPVVKVNAIEIH